MSTPEKSGESQQTTLAEDLEALGTLFSQMETTNVTEAPNTSQPESSTEVNEAGLPELEIDGFAHCCGDPGTRTFSFPSMPEILPVKVSPNNLNLVPISPARDADGYCLETPMFEDSSHSNVVCRAFKAVVHDAPLFGFATRVALARLTAETGATPSRAPLDKNWDIRVTDKEHRGQAIRKFRKYLPIYVPSDLPLPASSAMLSLLVPGGAGAYTWRFRDGNDIRAGYMPSSVRFNYPGGQSTVLAVYEQAPDRAIFGGSALTVENLKALEQYYRHKWGGSYWDQAYKTAAALSAVYVDPVSIDQDLGIGFSCVEQTTTHAGVDLKDYVSTEPGPSPYGYSQVSMPFDSWTTVPRCFDIHAIRAFGAIEGFTPTDAWVEWDPAKNEVTIKYRLDCVIKSHTSRLDQALYWIASPANGTPSSVALRAFRMVTADPILTLSKRYALAGSEDDEGVPYQGFRNVFGFNDASKLALPTFDVGRAVCLLAGVHLPEKISEGTYIDYDRLWDWMRAYVLRLHIAHAIKLAELKIWPDSLHLRPLEHAKVVGGLPDGLICLTHISSPSRKHLSAINWQLLEPILYLKASGSGVEYHGYDVRGSWEVNGMHVVDVASKDTDYPALDAAVRCVWNGGGKVYTVGRTTEDLQPVGHQW